MKTKKFNKKLALNKETIAYLNNLEMKAVEGKEQLCATGGFEYKTCQTAFLPTLCDTCLSDWPEAPICC